MVQGLPGGRTGIRCPLRKPWRGYQAPLALRGRPRDLPGPVCEAQHATGNAQSIGDSLQHVDMGQTTTSSHDLADPAGRHATKGGDTRGVDPCLDLDQLEDAGEVAFLACVLPLRAAQQGWWQHPMRLRCGHVCPSPSSHGSVLSGRSSADDFTHVG
ncbi:hypothetical protein SMALA_4147 [Streptomyces malaysiensis subsp. malaysiensis]|nr:hypothetical protein SMALA_4147 [Streptomyces malaysiensis]